MLSGLFCLLAIAGPPPVAGPAPAVAPAVAPADVPAVAPTPAAPKVLRPVSATEAAPVFAVGDIVTIAVDDANLRADGSTNQKAIGTLSFGTMVKIVEAAPAPVTIGLLTQRWYRIEAVTNPSAIPSAAPSTKPVSGWVFGNTVTSIGDDRFSVTLSGDDHPVVRFFRLTGDPRVVSIELEGRASTVSAVVTSPISDRLGLMVRSCTGEGVCTDTVVGQGAHLAMALQSAPSPSLSLDASSVTRGPAGYALHGSSFDVYELNRLVSPPPDEARLTEMFEANCHAVVEGDADEMGMVRQTPMCLLREFSQNCAPDDRCWDLQESCLDQCGDTCTTCDARCANRCDTCKAGCKTPACTKACASKRTACFTGCVKKADGCRSAPTCERVRRDCEFHQPPRVEVE